MSNWPFLPGIVVLSVFSLFSLMQAQESVPEKEPLKTVKGMMQARPGGPLEEVEVTVHEVPVDPPAVPAAEAKLPDSDLVLGVFMEGEAMAYPVRYLANYEVLDGRVGKTPVAPTW